MAKIKLITKDTVLPTIKLFNWDVMINNKPYYAGRIPGFIHCIGGRWGENDIWAWSREEDPCYENLVEFSCDSPICWGIEYKPENGRVVKWGETEARTCSGVNITRIRLFLLTAAESHRYKRRIYMPVKETCCTHCAHLHVCAYKGYIIGAQEAIDKLTIMTPKAEHEYIHDIEFIKPINVECTYYTPSILTRKDRSAKAPPLQGYSRNEVRKD